MNQISPAGFQGIEPPNRYQHHKFSKEIAQQIKTLKSDNWHGPIYILKDYTVISAFIWLVLGVSWWFYPLALIMIGAHQRAISTILHDSAHGVLTRHRTLNFLLGTLPTAWLIFQRHFAYKKSHVHSHHPFLGRAEDDPDLEFFIKEGVFTPRSDRAFLFRILILPLLGSKTVAYLKYLIKNRFPMTRDVLQSSTATNDGKQENDWRQRLDRWGFSLFWISALWACWTYGLIGELILLWVLPYLTSFHIIGWFIEMSEHCSSIDGQTVNVHMTRNRQSRHIEKWLTGINNDPHHLDHHLDPTTPFWLLPKARVIHMQDPVYAAHCHETGGLFQKGPNGERSILSLIRQQNRARYEMTQARAC